MAAQQDEPGTAALAGLCPPLLGNGGRGALWVTAAVAPGRGALWDAWPERGGLWVAAPGSVHGAESDGPAAAAAAARAGPGPPPPPPRTLPCPAPPRPASPPTAAGLR